MQTIYLLVIGPGVFVISTLALGNMLGIMNLKKAAEIITRVTRVVGALPDGNFALMLVAVLLRFSRHLSLFLPV